MRQLDAAFAETLLVSAITDLPFRLTVCMTIFMAKMTAGPRKAWGRPNCFVLRPNALARD
jgi:hypothetical protein